MSKKANELLIDQYISFLLCAYFTLFAAAVGMDK